MYYHNINLFCIYQIKALYHSLLISWSIRSTPYIDPDQEKGVMFVQYILILCSEQNNEVSLKNLYCSVVSLRKSRDLQRMGGCMI